MKNLFKSMMLVAAAAMSFASCSEDATEELAAPARQTKTITVNADLTRTEFGATREELVWSASDQFGVYTDVASNKNIVSKTYEASGGAFTFEVDAAATAIYAYYPYYFGNDSHAGTAVNFGIPDQQTWNGPGILYGHNIPMAASGTIEGSSVRLSFKQLACVLALNVYGGTTGETLSSITLTTKEGSCGRVDMDITKDPVVYEPEATATTVTLSPYKNAEAVVVDAAAVDDQLTYANQVYLVVAKRTYDKEAKFVVTTSNETYTFTTKAALDCTTSDFKAINLDLRKGVIEEPVTYTRVSSLAELNTSDTYIIAGNNVNTYAESPNMWVWNGTIASKPTQLNCVEYTADAETVSAKPSSIGEIKLEAAGASNSYYIKVGNQYLYNASNNTLSMSETDKTAWTIHEDLKSPKEGMYFSHNNCWIFCNTAGATALRAYTSSTQYHGIYFFKKADPNAPQLNITSENPLTVAADGLVDDGTDFPTITYEIKNPNAAWTVNASVPTEDQSWITVLDMSTEGNIVLDVQSNDGAARSTTVTVTYGDAITKTVTVKQEGVASASGGKVSYVFSDHYSADTLVTNIELNADISAVFAKGSGSTAPKYYVNGNAVRVYQNNTLTLSGATITKVVITTTTSNHGTWKDGSTTLTTSDAVTTWEGNTTNLTLTQTNKTQARITKIEVSYE